MLLPVFSVLRYLQVILPLRKSESDIFYDLRGNFCPRLDVCHDMPRCEKFKDIFLLLTMVLCRLQTGVEVVSGRNAVYFQSHIVPLERLWAEMTHYRN